MHLSPNRFNCSPYFLSIQKREQIADTDANNVVNYISVFSRKNHIVTSMIFMFYARARMNIKKIGYKKKRKSDKNVKCNKIGPLREINDMRSRDNIISTLFISIFNYHYLIRDYPRDESIKTL